MRNFVVAFTLASIVPISAGMLIHGSAIIVPNTAGYQGHKLDTTVVCPSVHPTNTSKNDSDPLVGPIGKLKVLPSVSNSLLPDFTHGSRATFHPHGEQVCASGCAASRHPTDSLTPAHFTELLREYAAEPLGTVGSAQDALLYYGRQTSAMLASQDTHAIDPIRLVTLKNQLAFNHAAIEIRVVDSTGQIRAALPSTQVPLDRRHEFELDTHDLQPMIASGTVKRVGRDYVWTRL